MLEILLVPNHTFNTEITTSIIKNGGVWSNGDEIPSWIKKNSSKKSFGNNHKLWKRFAAKTIKLETPDWSDFTELSGFCKCKYSLCSMHNLFRSQALPKLTLIFKAEDFFLQDILLGKSLKLIVDKMKV